MSRLSKFEEKKNRIAKIEKLKDETERKNRELQKANKEKKK